MPNVSTRFHSVAQALVPTVSSYYPVGLQERLSALYTQAQRSDYVFASPVGPFYHQAKHYHLPRFVYFGPQASDESLRLALYAGEDASDQRGTFALLHLVERLALEPQLGHGLNLSFFPLVDALGLEPEAPARHLADEHWGYSHAPEIRLLEKDARLRGYHAFVRLTTGHDELVTVRLRSRDQLGTLGSELITSEDIDPWAVRFEAAEYQTMTESGPLTIGDDLPFRPFELTLALPASWPQPLFDAATVSILSRFIERYRSHRAYAQNL